MASVQLKNQNQSISFLKPHNLSFEPMGPDSNTILQSHALGEQKPYSKIKKPIKLTIKPALFYKFNRQSDTLQKSHRQSSKDLLRRFKLSASKRSQERCETIDFYNGNGKSYSPTSNNYYSSNNNKPPKLKLRLSQDYTKNRWSTKSR